MKYIKRFFALTVFFIAVSSAFAEFRTIDTRYFVIVYDTEFSEQAAQLLAHHADDIADDVCAYFSVKPEKAKMPVFLKPHEENINGYYTGSPYAHIVLYDTLPTDGIIANNTDNLLTVFKHEFTHAVTMRGLFSLTFPLAMREGMAVLSESINGEGRLNDPRVLQIIKQRKIDGEPIRWNDIEMRDTYPTATLGYIYGGAFSQFLAEVYGVEKYAEFLKMHPKWFTTRNFKLAFGKNIADLFSAFLDTVPVPEQISEPQYFLERRTKSLYGTAASWKNKIAVFDQNEKAVFLYDAHTEKKQKLFSLNGSVYHLSFSADGTLLTVSLFLYRKGGTVSEIAIYDTVQKKFLKEKYTSLRYASFTPDNQSLIAVKSTSQHAELVLIDRKTKAEKVLLTCTPETAYTNIYNAIALSDGVYACIAGNGVNRDIVFVSADGTLEKLKLPFAAKGISDLTNVHSENGAFTFSYILDESLVRMAYVNVETKTLRMLDKDISGGTDCPVAVEQTENPEAKKFITIARHDTYDVLCTIDESELVNGVYASEMLSVEGTRDPETAFETERYNPIMNMWKPSVLPYLDVGTDAKNTSYGLSFSSQDVIGRLSYNFTAAVMPVPTFAQLDFTGSLKTNGNTVSLAVSDITKVITANKGIRQTGFGLKNGNAVAVQNTVIDFVTEFGTSWFAPIDLTQKNIYKQAYTDTVITGSQAIFVSHFIGRERLGKKFFAKDTFGVGNDLQGTVGYNVSGKITAMQVQDSLTLKTPVVPLTVQLAGSISYHAKLNPVTGMYRFEDSPAGLATSYLPAMKEHAAYYTEKENGALNGAFGGTAELRIFSVEIQKGSVWLPICYNRFNIDVGYKAVVNAAFSKQTEFLQSLFTGLSFTVSGAADIGFSYAHPLVKKAKIGSFNFLLNLSL